MSQENANQETDIIAGHQPDRPDIPLEEVVGGYFIQEEEEQRRNDGKLQLEYYLDSFDVINMVQGAMAYDTGMKFDQDALQRDERRNLVYALAFQGLFRSIRMLPPHQFEFESKLYKSEVFFIAPRNKEQFLGLYNQVFVAMGLEIPGPFQKLDYSLIDEHVQQLIDKGADLFTGNYLLREYTWANRLKHLINSRVLLINSQDIQDVARIENTELFRTIKKGFDVVRPEYPTNNFYDALAFFHLQRKLQDYLDAPAQNPLPVFYASSPVVRDAIKVIRDNNSTLFAYQQGNKVIPVVRDSLFFILEAIFTIGDDTEDFFEGLRKAQPEIKALMKKEYKRYYGEEVIRDMEFRRKKFEERIREIIQVKFVKEIWIKHKAYQKLVDEMKMAYSLDEEHLPIVGKKLKKALDEALKEAKVDLSHSLKLSAIINAFQGLSADVRKCLGTIPSSEVFRDFALMKFGLNREKLPLLQDRIQELMAHNENQKEQPSVIYPVISALAIRPDNKEKAKHFLSALAVAWLLDKHELIEALCSDFGKDDMKKRYETAMIFAASLIAIKRNPAGIERTQEIIDCILSQVKNNYKVWLGVAYLYFQIWESKTSLKPDLPEMNKKIWERQRKSREYERYVLHGAIKYARKAYGYLKKKKKEESLDHNFRLQNFLYALNNVIYYITKCGSSGEFSKLDNLVDELHSYDKNIEWQGRFNDTLGWYYLRRFYQAENEKLRKGYLEEAETNYRLARSRIASPRDQRLYEHLHRAILRAMEERSDQ
ncbi:MAG: hypothetical protein H6559_37980 [Lewinellaceae bacterium]|nr:hypothetical protein [Lewinellaceae bacterium]